MCWTPGLVRLAQDKIRAVWVNLFSQKGVTAWLGVGKFIFSKGRDRLAWGDK
jgi:hypothetical protein